MRRRPARLLCAACVAWWVPGCTIPVQRKDWSTYDGPGAEYFHREEYELPYNPDPLEPMNRVFVGINFGVVVAIVDPLATGWRFLVPRPARTSLVNASYNIEYPKRAVNHLLQGNDQKARSESERFGLNSTVGALGLGDPAGARGLSPATTDTGMTLNRWGWRDSAYLTFPFGTPGTVRDVLGRIGDTLLDPTTYFFPLGLAKSFVVVSERVSDYARFAQTSQDFYDGSRRIWTASRRIVDDHASNDAGPEADPDVAGSETDPAASEPAGGDAALQTIRYSGFTFDDPWFPYEARTRTALISSTGRKLPYDCYLQPIRSPVVFVVPGFGGHRRSKQVTAVVEMLYRGGHAVVVISSPTNFEFMRNAATLTVPGFLPEDSRDVHEALDAVWRDFYERYGGRVYKRMLVGTSLGGAYVLSIAAAEGSRDFVDFSVYVAIDPPVQLRNAAEVLDAYYNTPLTYSPEERQDRVAAALQKVIALDAPERRSGTFEPRLKPHEARFLIGLYYRLALLDVIWVSQERLDMGILKTERRPLQRAAASQEMLDYSLMEYAYALLLPQMLQRGVVSSDDDLFAQSDLRALDARLRQNAKARVVCNANDILLIDSDLAWLRDVFGPVRLIVHDNGGHMGNLDDPDVRASILGLLDEPLSNGQTVDSDVRTRAAG